MAARHDYHETMDIALQQLEQQSHDVIRRRLLISSVSTHIDTDTPGPSTPSFSFILARYPFNPTYSPWTQMTVFFEHSPTAFPVDITVDLFYTIDNATTWNVIALDNTGDSVCGTEYRGSYAVDLSTILGPTWLGVKAVIDPDGLPPGETILCRSHVYLERPGY
jgi:hypothetical protein